MGYFPNGTSGEAYEERYCSKCVHDGNEETGSCPVMLAHLIHNYDECNNKDSILHILIPRSEDGLANEKCGMFIETPAE